MNHFNIGDVVSLKSGGPRMTVEEIIEYSGKSNDSFGTFPPFDEYSKKSGTYVKCTWFYGGKRMSETFHPDVLKLDED